MPGSEGALQPARSCKDPAAPPHTHAPGCDSGRVYNVRVPSLEGYARWQAHPHGPVLDLLPLHGCCLSLSQERAVLSACGGAPRLTHIDEVRPGSERRLHLWL